MLISRISCRGIISRKKSAKPSFKLDYDLAFPMRSLQPRKMRYVFPLLYDSKRTEQLQVDEHLNNRSFRATCKTDTVNLASICTLRPRQWLNDEVINLYGGLLAQRAESKEGANKIHYFNSFFYQKVSQEGYAKVARWTKKVCTLHQCLDRHSPPSSRRPQLYSVACKCKRG